MTTLDDLRELRDEAARADRAYREALAQARAEGHSLRAIADAVGVSHQTVANLIATLDRG